MLLCLDGGTTNTRLRLIREHTVCDIEKTNVGSSAKDNSALKVAVKDMIVRLLARNGLTEADIEAILAVGMVTSEFGLYQLPHIYAPAGYTAFHNGMARVMLPDVSGIPFFFIPGFRNAPDSANMMRGEESECLGLCSQLGIDRPAAVILPGSHNKVILFDGEKISACYSTISGELIAAVAGHTILRHCFSLPLPKIFDEGGLIAGAECAEENGLTMALIRIRSLSLSGQYSQEYLSSDMVGAILYEDIRAIRKYSEGLPLVIGGSDPLKSEIAALAKRFLPNEVFVAPAETAENSSAIGSVNIYESK